MSRTLLPLLGTALLTVACGVTSATQTPPAPVAVTTAVVTSATLPSSFDAGGVVRSRSTAVIASRVMAPVVAVYVRAGDRVRRGSRLVELDAREATANRDRARASLVSTEENIHAADAEVRAAEAAVVLARATHDRIKTLHERRSATPQEMDQATASLAAAEAQLTNAKAHVAAAAAARDASKAAEDSADVTASYAVLTAPFDGLVVERSIDPGAMAYPAATLLTIEDTAAFTLDVTLDEARAHELTAGQAVDVELGDALFTDRPLQARVREIARIDATSHSFLVKIALPADDGLRSGMFGRARFTGAGRRTLVVPASAAIQRGQLTFVFAVDANHRARLQPISPGPRSADRLEVLAGLREGERVVTNPPPALSDGTPVTGDQR